MIGKIYLVIPKTKNTRQIIVGITSFSNKLTVSKEYRVHLIKYVYLYSFKGVVFYQSMIFDSDILNLISRSMKSKKIKASKRQTFICKNINLRIDNWFKQESNGFIDC